MEALNLGDPLESSTRMAPQADRKQAEAITKFLEIGNKEGLALTGGKPASDRGENFIQPTVFAGLVIPVDPALKRFSARFWFF
jgi:acyl-CoA reductase-like NAD-dependent aldehyde dehydrogenase